MQLVSKHIVTLLCCMLCLPMRSVGQSQSDRATLLRQAQRCESQNNAVEAVYYYNKVAHLFWNQGLSDSAILYFQHVLKLSERVQNHNALKVVNTNLGLLYSDRREFGAALNCFSCAVEHARQLNNRSEIANTLINLANAQIETKRYEQAEKSLLNAKNIATELNNKVLLKNCFFNLNSLYQKWGKSAKANESFASYTMLVSQLQQQERSKVQEIVDDAERKVQSMAQQKELTSKQLEQTSEQLKLQEDSLRKVEMLSHDQQMQIALLNAEMKLRDAEIQRQQVMQMVYIGIIILSTIIALLIYYAYFLKKRTNKILNDKNAEISQQKEEITLQANKLHDINATKDKLFSIISHDLRSPLFSLLTLLNLVKESEIDEGMFKQVIADISDNVNYTSMMLENLLTWARSQMQGIKVNITLLNLNQVVQPTLDVLNEMARQKQVEISNKLDKSVKVLADSGLLTIVVRNLVSNAIKFCNEGAVITLSCALDAEQARVCVSDTGVGMPPEVLCKLFGSEIESTRGTKEERGTGLGLMLCKDFVELMQGQIWAESQLGKGSQFYFTLRVNE